MSIYKNLSKDIIREAINEATIIIGESVIKNVTYDKIKYHIDNGEDKNKVLRKFKAIFQFLDRKKLLTIEGKEEYKYLCEDSILNSNMVNNLGNQFLDKYYNSDILPSIATSSTLTKCWNYFSSKRKISEKDLEKIFNKYSDIFIAELSKTSVDSDNYKIIKNNKQLVIASTDNYNSTISKYQSILIKTANIAESKISNDTSYNNINIICDWIHNDSDFAITFESID